MKKINVLILFIIIISIPFISCQRSGGACCNTDFAPRHGYAVVNVKSKSKTENTKMTIYPKLYADFVNSSFQNQLVTAKGKLGTFKSYDSNVSIGLILITSQGILAQIGNAIHFFDFKGSLKWIHEGGRLLLADDKHIFLGLDQTVIILNYKNKPLSETQFEIRGGGITITHPFNEDYLFAHYRVYGENDIDTEAHEQAAPTSTEIAMVKTGYEMEMDDLEPGNKNSKIKYRERFDYYSLPLITKDKKSSVILDNGSNTIKIFDIETGNKKSEFKPEKSSEFISASIDRKNDLIVFLREWNPDAHENKLSSYSLSGKLKWSISFGKGEDYNQVSQPPAIDSKNRAYFIWKNEVLLIENGKILRKTAIPRQKYYQFVTVAGDDSILIASSNMIKHMDKEGTALFTATLEKNETLSTPPVIGNNGKIYIATSKGIRIIE